MNIQLTFRWDDAATNFIENKLPRFAKEIHDAVLFYLTGGTSEGGVFNDFIRENVPKAPDFEGDLSNPENYIARSIYSRALVGQYKYRYWIGEKSNSPFKVREDSRKYDVFSYALGKHKGDAAGPHRVWLYASDTAHRKKLRRWVRQNLVSELPESESEAEDLRAQGVKIPMFIDVDPSRTATVFFRTSELMSMIANEQAFKEQVGGRLRSFWEGV